MEKNKNYEYVLKIAESSSVSIAAEHLGIAQSALSRYISKLEKELGVELFDRTKLPLELTEAGKYYVEFGKKVIELNNVLQKKLDEVKDRKKGIIRFGIGPSRATTIIPMIMDEIADINNCMRISVYECLSTELSSRLRDNKLDFIISFMDSDTTGFCFEELFEESVLLAVPKRYVLDVQSKLENDAIEISKLTIPFVALNEGQQLRRVLDTLTCHRSTITHTSDSIETLSTLVERGFGVSIVPSYWKYSSHASEIQYFPLYIPDKIMKDDKIGLREIINRKVCIFYNGKYGLTAIEREFISACQKACKLFREDEC